MSEHEALMWNIEKDPWLNPNGASLTLLDQPVDFERFRQQLRWGVSRMPRLYQRVLPGVGRLCPPMWAPDPEFDVDYHVREMELCGPGSDRQLLDLAAQLYEEPFDRTRPLWRFVAIRGIEGGRGAVWSMTHHAIADGVGQLRMAELYQQLDRDDPPPPPVALEAIVAEAAAKSMVGGMQGNSPSELLKVASETVGRAAKHPLGLARSMVGEMMMWPADPTRVGAAVEGVAQTAASVASLVSESGGVARGDEQASGGSPLWAARSRQRHLEHVSISLDDLKLAAAHWGGSINDAFMVGLIEGAVRYHSERDTPVEVLNTSMVVNTRADDAMGGNSFSPVMMTVSGLAMSFGTRMEEISALAAKARNDVDRSGGLAGLAGLINLLPTSVVTRTARYQAARMDFATSNLRGAGFTLFCAGAQITAIIPMGPVAGTAANATALSYDGNFDVGLFVDPAAILDPGDYQRHVAEAFADFITDADAQGT